MPEYMGIRQFDPSLDIQAMHAQSQLLQQLGARVRTDIATIQTNRQLAGLAQAAQNVNVESPDFPKQAISLISQYPMAVQSPVGAAAINQLGAAHKLWAQEQAAIRNPYTPVAGTNAILNRQTGQVTQLPEGSRPSHPIQINKNTTGVYDPATGETLPVGAIGLPEPSFTDPFALEQAKQQNRLELEKQRQARPSPSAGKPNPYGERLILDKKKEAEAAKDELDAATNELVNAQPGIMGTGIRGKSETEMKSLQETVAQKRKALERAMESFKHAQDYFKAPVQEATIPGVDATSSAAGADALIPHGTRQLDPKTAAELVREAGGDKDKARALARERGYSY